MAKGHEAQGAGPKAAGHVDNLVPRGLDVQSPLGEGGFHADEEGTLLDPGGGDYRGGAGLWDTE